MRNRVSDRTARRVQYMIKAGDRPGMPSLAYSGLPSWPSVRPQGRLQCRDPVEQVGDEPERRIVQGEARAEALHAAPGCAGRCGPWHVSLLPPQRSRVEAGFRRELLEQPPLGAGPDDQVQVAVAHPVAAPSAVSTRPTLPGGVGRPHPQSVSPRARDGRGTSCVCAVCPVRAECPTRTRRELHGLKMWRGLPAGTLPCKRTQSPSSEGGSA